MAEDRVEPETTEPGTTSGVPPEDATPAPDQQAVQTTGQGVTILRGNRPTSASDTTVLRGNEPGGSPDVTILRGNRPGPSLITPTPGTGAPGHPVHSENLADARMQGYDWTQINDHLAAARTTAQTWGYTDAEIDQHLGIQDSSAAFNRFSQTWNQEFAASPDRLAEATVPAKLPTAGVNWANNLPEQAGIELPNPPFPSLPRFNPNGIDPGISEPTLPGEPGELSPTGLFKNKPGVTLPLNLFNQNMRDDFAFAVSHDMVQNLDQFTDLYARAAFGALDPYAKGQRGNLYAEATGVIKDNLELARQQLKASLPNPQDFLDSGILLAQQQDMEADPSAAVAVRNRLLDHWANTGMEPMMTYQSAQHNPALQALLAGYQEDQPHDLTNAMKNVGHAMGEGWSTNWAGNLDNWQSPADIQKAFESQTNPVLGTLYAGFAAAAGGASTAISTIFRAYGAGVLPVLAAGNQWLSEMGIHELEGNTQARPGTPAGSAETAAQQMALFTAMLPDFTLAHSAAYPGKLLGPGETGVAPATFVKASSAYRALSATAKSVLEDESGALKPIKPVVADPLAKDPAAALKKVDPTALVPASQDFSIKAMPPVRELDTEGKPTGAFRPQDHSIMSGDGKTPLTVAQVTRDETGANARLTPNPDLSPEMKLEVARRVMADDRNVRSITLDDKAGAFDRGAIFKGGDVMAKLGMQPADIIEKLTQDKIGSSASKGFAKKAAALTPDQPGHTFTEMAEKADADPATMDLAKGNDVGTAVEAAFHDLRTNPTGKLGLDLFLSVEGAMRKANMRTVRDLSRAQAIMAEGDSAHSIAYAKTVMRPWYAAAKLFLDDYDAKRRSGIPGAFMDNPLHIMTKMIDGTAGTVTLDRNSPLHPVAEGMQALFADAMQKMKTAGLNSDQYFQDAFRTIWRRPGKADAAFLQGRNTLDHWPTPSEGLEKGLEPIDAHPLNMYSKVLGQMYHAVAAKETLNWGQQMTYHGIPLLEYQVGSAKAPIGYVRLTGAGAQKITMVPTGEVDEAGKPKMKPAIASAWADPGFAKTYNYWQSRGMYDGMGADGQAMADGPTRFFRQAQYFTNTVLGMKLLVPTYHALAITGETMIATLATGLGELAHGATKGDLGELGRGLKDVGLAATGVGSVAQTLVRGWKFHNEYMQKSLADSPAAQAFADAGGRGQAQRQELFASAKGGNWFQAIRNNSLSFELKEGARDALFGKRDAASVFKWDQDQSPAERAVLAPARVLGFAAHELGRIVNTFTAPVFDGLVPFSKMGAYGNEMDMFLRQNPTASREDITARGRMLVNSMDNRFGELNQNNLFWHALTKQILNTALVSVGWEYGSLRAFGNAAGWDMGRSMGRGALAWNPVAFRWALAFGAGAAYQNAIYQYARTGKLPWQTNTWLMDLIQPRDSGVYPDGMPRRGVLPGYQKDVFNMARVVMNPSGHAGGQIEELRDLVGGKLTPAWKMVYNSLYGMSDFRDQPIKLASGGYRKADVTSWNDLSVNFYRHVLRPGLIPIQQETTEQLRKGTGLNKPLTIAGIRETAPWLADYPAYKRGVDMHDKVQQAIAGSRAKKTDAQLLNPNE